MKKFIYISGLLITMLFAGNACDIIEPPFLESHEQGGGETPDNPANVLVIDFTGHTCKSCPKAHHMIQQLDELYGDRIIAVAFHVGYFARTDNDKYTMDFNTDEGAELESYYQIVSYPIGLVNTLSKESLSPYSEWATESAKALENDALVYIGLSDSYNSDSRKLNLDIDLYPAGELPDDYSSNMKLAVYLTESHIFSWQKDEEADPMDVENYEHNHVFRKAFGSVWGEDISLEGAESDNPLRETKAIVLDESWVANNCSVVAFVYNSATMEVIQSKLIKLEL